MQFSKLLRPGILALLFVVLTIFPGCGGGGGTAPPINHSPTIISLTSNPPSPIEVNQSTVITCIAIDQDGDILTYNWTKSGGTISGSGSAIIWTAPATAGTYTITCTVSDGELIDIQAISIVLTEPEPENQPPAITSTVVTSATVGEAYTYDVEATDSDGGTLTYTLTTSPASMTISSSTGIITWTPTTAGSYEVTVEVSDGDLSDTQSFTIVVLEPEPENRPPVISSLSADLSSIDINQSSTITCIATDPDGDTLTYSWIETGGTITGSGSAIIWTAPNTAGTYTITCTVSDNNGGEDSESVSIIVSDLGSVSSVGAVAVTYHLYKGKEQSIINKLIKEDKIHQSNPIIKSEKVDKSGITYAIDVEWAKFNGASGYKVYRSVNWTAFQLVYTEEVSYDHEWYGFWDDDVQIGNIYAYYVIAYGPFGETVPDKIVSIDTWLPSCSLINPLDMAAITNPNPTFTWSPVGISTFPYGTIYSAESDLWVYDETDGEQVWWTWFDDMTTSNAIYNQDGEATPLVPGHTYSWDSWGYGYDENGNLIAISESEDWGFDYEGGAIPSSVCRAFLVGVGDYQYFPDAYGNTDLSAPPHDVNMMYDTLSHSGSGFSSISELIDLQATKSAILNGIANAFSGADSDDVSYFYFTGHGINYEGISYLCPTDVSYYSPLSSYISTNELESALSAVPGTKVIFLDSCYSGGFIGKEINQGDIEGYSKNFNDDVINIFMTRDLANSQYQVLTSCLSSQECVELTPSEGDSFGLFSGVLCLGCGYDSYTHSYPADENENGEITLHEAYTYTDETVNAAVAELNYTYGWDIDQNTQVYPLNSDFVIIEE